MSKVKTFSRWFKNFSSLGDAALEQAIVSVFDRAERAEVYKELDQNPDIDMHDMVCCIAYADHCTAPLLARIAELEAAQTWQPIESAPKDGRRVFVVIEGVDRGVLAFWNGCEWATIDGNDWQGRKIKFWMPLPTPPKGGAL